MQDPVAQQLAFFLLPRSVKESPMKSKDLRDDEDARDAQRRTRDHGDRDLTESRPTPGSAEGERDVQDQSRSNVPRSDSGRH